MAKTTPSNDDEDDDAGTTAALDSSFTIDGGGLCGALPESAVASTCSALPIASLPSKAHHVMKERIVEMKQKGEERFVDLRQKVVGGGLISKLKNRGGASGGDYSSEGSASLYDRGMYLCAAGAADGDHDDDGDDVVRAAREDQPIPASAIGDPSRTVCVVTTAALPWRTGTAVNPLLRALYLVRWQQRERRRTMEKKVEEGNERRKEAIGGAPNDDASDVGGGVEVGSVTLVIPWLESERDRAELYGRNNEFANAKEQEEWMRSYCRKRCNKVEEEKELKLIFYPAFYLAGFGSIFPKVDLCNFIPRELVDVAILEEPEHLNWFRMPNSNEKSNRALVGVDAENDSDDDEKDSSDHSHQSKKIGEVEQHSEQGKTSSLEESGGIGQKVEVNINEMPSNDLADTDEKPADATMNNNDKQQQQQIPSKKKIIEKAKLGWMHRFHFVVGIVHTNYEAYARQYGIGASLIAAPTIGAMSALTIRAYCHQVIKLSDTLPNFAPGKEVTCNVHGVRSEFLEGVDLDVLKHRRRHDGEVKDGGVEDDAEAPSPVYFIGKLVWAKGFDLMLELQDIFRKRSGNGEYFHIDVYGGGPDEKAIARAFHGRHHKLPTKRPTPPPPSKNEGVAPDAPSPRDLKAAAVFSHTSSIKDLSSRAIERMDQQSRSSSRSDGGSVELDDVVDRYLSLGFEVSRMTGSATYVHESRSGAPEGEQGGERNSSKNPLDILGDLSGKSIDTGVKTSQAVYNIADSSIKNILTMSFSQLKRPLKHRKEKAEAAAKGHAGSKTTDEDRKEEGKQSHFVFDPPASRYEWRRHPIPAKFPGVIDHAQLKNVPHKIFLNPSTSEVLCTTTAEALAMNKFAIIPRHPSNDFFMQFTNCLPYDTLEECADRMEWALENTPALLSEEERRKFTWEAATERLLESSIVTLKQARERAENGMDKTDARIAYWLSESGEKSNMIRNLFHKNGDGVGDHSPPTDR